MLSLWSALMAVCLAGVIASPSRDQRQIGNNRYYDNRGVCYTSEGVFRHGQIVTTRRSPCLKYRCEVGRLRLYESACPYGGSCHPEGSRWKARDCHTYTCRRMDYNSYRIDRLHSGCKDAYGNCRNPGDVFPYPVEGHIYPGCTCTTTPSVIRYSCNYPWQHGSRQLTREVQQ